MAHRRGRSVPGHREGRLHLNEGEPVNPFWSQGVQEAAMVDRLRPANLPPVRVTPESLPPVPADDWDGDETPRPVQGLSRAMGSGGGLLRSQGRMPAVAFETPSSWEPHTPGPQGTQVFRMEEEASNFNLFDFDEDLAQQSSCAGIPQVDLLGPLGGEGHRGKGQGGNDHGERQGDRLRSQGPLRQDRGGREREPPEQRQCSLDLLGDVLRGAHGDVSTLQRGRAQSPRAQSPKNPQRGGSRHRNDRGSRGLSGDHHRNDQSRSRGEDRVKDHLQGKEIRAEPKKIQPKDQKGSTLEQDLSSLLVQQLMQENEELRKRLDAINKNQPSSHGQQGQRAQQDQQRDELDTSSWESIPSRATPTTPTNRQTKDVAKVTPGGTQLPDGPPPIDKVEKDPTPPPLPPVPPMVFGGYEEHNEAGVNKWLGPQAVRVGAQQGDGDVHGFWNSRRGGIQQVPDPEAERVQRLEQELKELREALTMRRVPGQEPLGAYGAQPFQRVGPPTADPPGAQWHLRQACNDVNMRDWVQVNSGNPYLHQQESSMTGNQLGQQGGQFGNLGQGVGQHHGGGFGDPRSPLGGGVQDDRPREEELKPVTITLPKLPELGGKNQGLEAGDWMAQIRPQIADVSHRAMWWWDNLVTMTTQRYQQWLGSDPITRLNVQPPTVEELPQGFTRLEQRVTSLLMQALPKTLAAEMIANRQLGAAQIIFKVMKVYQPGGLGERQNTLQALTTTQPAGTYLEASTSLRMWQRHHSRAEELGATVPDPTLMVGALDKIMSKLLQGNPQANFRLSAFRMGAQVDTKPTAATVKQLHQMLLAEVELAMGSQDAQGKGQGSPAVKTLKDNKAGSPAQPVCRFWKSDQGCRHGAQCKFQHPAHEDGKYHCYTCGATNHKKPDCPYNSPTKEDKSNTTTGASKGSPAGGSGAGGGDGKGAGKQGGKSSKGKSGKTNRDDQKGNSAGSKDDHKNVKKVETEGGKEAPADAKGTSGAGTGETSTLVTEVSSLIKTLKTPESSSTAYRHVKTVNLRKIDMGKNQRVLIDGGATHVLRKAKSQEEWDLGEPVQVALASGTAELKQDAVTGSLLTLHDVQMIIPMAALTRLGYEVKWTGSGCKINSPDGAQLPVRLDQGCPTLPRREGVDILQRVEDHQRRETQMKLAAIRPNVELPKACPEVETVKRLKAMFPEVPADLAKEIPGFAEVDMNQVVFNRHHRRKVQRAKTLVVHLFSGDDPKFWMAQEKNGVVIICIELTKGADLRNGHLYGWLEQLARSGKIDVLLAGPPCRSVSVCRLRSLEGDDGPKIVRARHGSERFGRHDLTEEELKLVCNDNLLWMRTLWLAVQAYEANQNLEITLEQPQDPEQWKQPPADIKEKIPGWNGFPSFLAWPETEVMVKKCKLRRISFHQGALGHQTNKPTTVLTSTEELFDLQGLMSRGSSKEWPSDLNKRLELSSSLASWAPGLKNLLVKGINRVNTQTPAVCALSAVEQRQIKEWQLHVSNGHKPFRRDCAVCLEGAGRDRPRRRLQHPESYTLSIDLSGSHKKGIDQRGRPTYFMVAVYTVPVQDSFPLPEGLQQVAGGEKRRLQPPEGSPLDRDDLLEQFEKELEENLARAVAPQDLEQEDQAQAPQPGEDQEKKPEEEKDAIKKKDEDQKEGDDPWEIVSHRHEDLTAAEIRWWDVKDQF